MIRTKWKQIVAVAVLVLMLGGMIVIAGTSEASASGSSRKWNATYNAALSLKEAAVPARYKVGTRLLIEYKGNSLVVKAHPGGCTCFDLSDEAFRHLGGSGAISQGVIRVTVTERG